jgi:hypothetical protein
MGGRKFADKNIMKTHTGPADYKPTVSAKKISYSIQAHSKSQHTLVPSTLPGPGSYEDERKLHYTKLPGSKMGLEVRKGEFLKTASHGKPSTGKYD